MIGSAKRHKHNQSHQYDDNQDQIYSSQLPPSIAANYHRSQKNKRKGSNSVSFEAIERILRDIGQELSCPICLGILENAVSLPCTHLFCKDCFERSITIKPTKRDSLSTSSQCPLCKAHISKRSSSPADAIRILADAYKKTIIAYESDTGKHWDSIETELDKHKLCSNPVENMSQLYPYPEKTKKDISVVIQREKRSTLKSNKKVITINIDLQNVNATKTPKENRSENIIAVCTSLLSNDQQTVLMQWANTFNIKMSHNLTSQISHLIVKANSLRVTKRTMKYCQAILTGRWIISFEWIEACLKKNKLVPVESFEIQGDESCPDSGAPRRSRLSRFNGEVGLFDRMHFYFYGEFRQPSISDLISLVMEGDAEIIDDLETLSRSPINTPIHRKNIRPHKFNKRVIIICDLRQSNFEKDAGVISKYRPLVTSQWIMDCISVMELLPLEPYAAL